MGAAQHRIVMSAGAVPSQRDSHRYEIGVHTTDDAEAAVLAAVQGATVTAYVDGPGHLADLLQSDLRRLGSVEVLRGSVDEPLSEPDAAADLDPQVQALLDLMVDGATLGDAARALHLSRRTADRRLALARRALGVSTTTEVLVHVRLTRDRRMNAEAR
jgi:DNA-binding NarL/FixJ family response regulator